MLSSERRLVARYDGIGQNDLDFPASLVFHERAIYLTNLSLTDGGANSKLSVMGVPFPGEPWRL